MGLLLLTCCLPLFFPGSYKERRFLFDTEETKRPSSSNSRGLRGGTRRYSSVQGCEPHPNPCREGISPATPTPSGRREWNSETQILDVFKSFFYLEFEVTKKDDTISTPT